MRDKGEILSDANKDITNERYKEDAPIWLTLRLIEVLLDIRDTLDTRLASLDNTILKYIIPKK